jgi:hypothetical protein
MNSNDSNDINRFRESVETFDPAAALLEALERIEILEEKIKVLESENIQRKKDLEESQIFLGRDLALMRQRMSKIEHKPAQPKQISRADNLREILKANPKGIKASEARRLMGISKYTLSRLIGTMEDIETRKANSDSRSMIIIFKTELVARNYQPFSVRHQ